ncbi:hypothetical protein L916_16294 [Phytophthora nicotianae]|uniref:Uncharacterized protein n=1 Tax=Phytophthora nicotianae TaxID=4792 RepID=W2IBC6_PHYNI|nr:hypothetical protein L916_16294 [Phytophthora nicotianae]
MSQVSSVTAKQNLTMTMTPIRMIKIVRSRSLIHTPRA